MTLPAAERALLQPEAWPIWEIVRDWAETLPGVRFRVQKSQVSLDRLRTFAAVWCPGAALHRPAAPLVLSVFAPERLDGPWKQVVEPYPGRFTHHAELQRPEDFTPALQAALRRAAL